MFYRIYWFNNVNITSVNRRVAKSEYYISKCIWIIIYFLFYGNNTLKTSVLLHADKVVDNLYANSLFIWLYICKLSIIDIYIP